MADEDLIIYDYCFNNYNGFPTVFHQVHGDWPNIDLLNFCNKYIKN
jgi:hypothetical protein